MTKTAIKLSPQGHLLLEQFGARVKAARLRRNLPQALVAERAGVSLMTYRSAEAGAPGCALGTYLAILEVLGLAQDLDLLAKEDQLGRNLQDGELRARASLRPSNFNVNISKESKVSNRPKVSKEQNVGEFSESSLAESKRLSRDDLIAHLIKPKKKG